MMLLELTTLLPAVVRIPTSGVALQRSTPRRSRQTIICSSSQESDADGSPTDWDREWRRYSLEGLDEQQQSESAPMADALADLLSAEAVREAARLDVEAAAAEKQRLQEELAELQRQKSQLPWQFEELDELQARIFNSDDDALPLKLGLRAAGLLLLVSLLLRWRTGGLEELVGCLAMPVVCAANDLMHGR